MKIYNFEQLAKTNTDYRRVITTGKYSQLVVMSLRIGEDIGLEVHPHTDQYIFIVDGDAEIVLGDQTQRVDDESLIVVDGGIEHNVRNIGDEDLRIITIYAPAEHRDGTVHPTKEDALKGGE